MPTQLRTYSYALTAGGGTLSLPADSSYELYRLTGTATLSGNWTIQASGTPISGQVYNILYTANLVLGSNTLTIFGTSITSDLATQKLNINCYYNGSAWEVKVNPDFSSVPFLTGSMIEDSTIDENNLATDSVSETKILDGAVTTDKIDDGAITAVKVADGALTPAKLATKTKYEVITMPVSFESGEQGDNTISIPYDFKINSVRYTVTKAIAGTDNASITMYINGTLTVPNSISITASTSISSTAITSITASNTGSSDQQVKFVTSKSTAGGKALLTINLERT